MSNNKFKLTDKAYSILKSLSLKINTIASLEEKYLETKDEYFKQEIDKLKHEIEIMCEVFGIPINH